MFFFSPTKLVILRRNSIICNRIEWKYRYNEEKKMGGKNWQFSDFRAEKNFKLKEKRSRVKPSWKYFSSSYCPCQLTIRYVLAASVYSSNGSSRLADHLANEIDRDPCYVNWKKQLQKHFFLIMKARTHHDRHVWFRKS